MTLPPPTSTRTDPTVPYTTCFRTAANNIAYIIYTSSTTGTSKGVAITHHNITQRSSSLHAAVPAAGVWAQWHSYAFDASIQEIWGALLGGGDRKRTRLNSRH